MENINTNDTMRNTTSCVSASPDVRQAPAEAPQPTKAAKKRAEKAKKGAYKAIVRGTEGIESIRLNGDAAKDAKKADLAKADEDYVKSAQKDAEYLAKEFRAFGELCKEADIAVSNRDAHFKNRMLVPDFRNRMQNVRDFFAVHHNKPRALREAKGLYLKGKDGKHYFSATEYFPAEIGVTYEYVRREVNKQMLALLEDAVIANPKPKRQPLLGKGDSPSGKVNLDELPDDARKKVLAAISGTETTMDIPPAEGESDDASTQEAPLTASVDERVQAAFAYVEAKYARLMSLDEKEDFYFKLSKKFYDWDVPPSAPVGDESSEARKAAVSEAADNLFEASKSAPASHKNRKALIAAKVQERKAAKAKEKEDNAAATIATPNNPTGDPAYREYLEAPLA